jgi:hypothetical protein
MLGEMAPLAHPAGTRIDATWQWLNIERLSGDPLKPSTTLTFDLEKVACILLIASLAWLLVTTCFHCAALFIARRRRRRNQCIACGHALGPIS